MIWPIDGDVIAKPKVLSTDDPPEEIARQTALAEIALHGETYNEQLAAVIKITNRKLLLEIAFNANADRQIRDYAIYVSTQETALADAFDMKNWYAGETQAEMLGDRTIKLSRRYHAKNDINVFKTRAYLEEFIKNEIADDHKISLNQESYIFRSSFWRFKGEYRSHALEVELWIYHTKYDRPATELVPCPTIYVKLESKPSNGLPNIDCWDDLTKILEGFLNNGYHSHAKNINPTNIKVITDFNSHDGGDAIIHIDYDSGEWEALPQDCSTWYTAPDCQGSSELLQEILGDYLRRVMLLDEYH